MRIYYMKLYECSSNKYLVIYQGWCIFRSILIIEIKNIMKLKWPNIKSENVLI